MTGRLWGRRGKKSVSHFKYSFSFPPELSSWLQDCVPQWKAKKPENLDVQFIKGETCEVTLAFKHVADFKSLVVLAGAVEGNWRFQRKLK